MKRKRLSILGTVCTLGALLASGCAPATAQPVEPPTAAPSGGEAGMPNPASVHCEEQGYTLEIRTDADGGQYGVCIFPDGSECEEWAFFRGECSPGTGGGGAEEAPEDVRAALDAALAYLAANYSADAPPAGLDWAAEFTTPEGLVGSGAYQFTSGDWVATVAYPVVAPENMIYDILVTNTATGFEWRGTVNPAGEVTEPGAGTGGLPVAGWLGSVVSTPDGAQFDDYLVLSPEGAGEVGLSGADEAIEAQIVALRDHEEPGKYANFWGTLTCGVPDYNGCQLLVSRIRVGPVVTDPEPIEGWEGTIHSLEPGMQFDDFFRLAGDYPVQFGIAPAIGEDGVPMLEEEIAALRDTGTTVRVWGRMICGVPDSNGCQIQVERIEVID